MEESRHQTHVNPAEATLPGAAGRTVTTPRFDEKSIQRAQPAVPLARHVRTHSRSGAFILLCVLAGLAGGVLGAYLLSLYQRGGARIESAEATRTPAQVAAPEQTTAPQTPAASQQAAASTQPPAAAPGMTTAPATSQAEQSARVGEEKPVTEAARKVEAETNATAEADPKTQAELRGALDEWLAATNARDVPKQMRFYGPTLDAFYLSRNASREAVRAEKARLFAAASAVDVRAASAPDIKVGRDGRTAVMRFRKRYQIGGSGGGQGRSGEVVQELRWRRTSDGWKRVGERDLRVIQ